MPIPGSVSYSPYSIPCPPSLFLQDCVPWFPLQTVRILFDVTSLGVHVTLTLQVCQQSASHAQLLLPVPIPWAAIIHSCHLESPAGSITAAHRPIHQTFALLKRPDRHLMLFQNRHWGHAVWIRSLPHQGLATLQIRYSLPSIHFGPWQILNIPLYVSPPPLLPITDISTEPLAPLIQPLLSARRVPPSHPLLPRFSIQGRFLKGMVEVEAIQSTSHTLVFQEKHGFIKVHAIPSLPRNQSVLACRWLPTHARSDARKVYMARQSRHSKLLARVSPPPSHPQCIAKHEEPTFRIRVILNLPNRTTWEDIARLGLLLSLLSDVSEGEHLTPSQCHSILSSKHSSWPAWIQSPSSMAQVPNPRPSSIEKMVWIIGGTAWDDRKSLLHQVEHHRQPLHLVLVGWPHDEARLREWVLLTQGSWMHLQSWGSPPSSAEGIASWIQNLCHTRLWRTSPSLEAVPDLLLGHGSQQPLLYSTSSRSLPRRLFSFSPQDSAEFPGHSRSVELSEYLEVKTPWLAQWERGAYIRWKEAEETRTGEARSLTSKRADMVSLRTCLYGTSGTIKPAELTDLIITQPWVQDSAAEPRVGEGDRLQL